jgi:hypothetical protein
MESKARAATLKSTLIKETFKAFILTFLFPENGMTPIREANKISN